MLNAFNPDVLEDVENTVLLKNMGASPLQIEAAIKAETEKFQNEAARVFTGELNDYNENVRKAHEQVIIDELNEALAA